MWFRYLTASAVCAALSALAATGLVRTHFSEVITALAPITPEASPSDERIQAESGTPSVMDPATEIEMPEALRPTSLLLRKDSRRHPAASARKVFPNRTMADFFAQKLDRGIRKLAERRYEIKRSTLELALGNLGLLAQSVRVMPEARDGKQLGFRLFAIMAEGPIAKLGLRSNDVLVSINGLDLATPDRVLDAFSKLKASPHLVLGLVRERDKLTQEYMIRQ
jgi:C-terminal processing protease CtpA/Prc